MLKKGFLANTTLTTSFCFNDKIIKKYLYEVNKVFQKINYCIKKILYPWKVKLSILLLKDLLIELIKKFTIFKMKINILDYNCGNIWSVKNAFNFLGYETNIIKSADQVLDSDCLILPGDGSFKIIKDMRNNNLFDSTKSYGKN